MQCLILFRTEGGDEHLGTAPHDWPFVSAPSDERVRYAGGIKIFAGKIKVLEEKPAPNASLCTTNPISTTL